MRRRIFRITLERVSRLLPHRIYRILKKVIKKIIEQTQNLPGKLHEKDLSSRKSMASSRARQSHIYTRKRKRGGMRIVQVLHYFLPKHQAGVEVYTYHLSKELSKKNDVFIYTSEDGYLDKEYYERDEIYHNLPVRRVYYNRPINFEKTYKNDVIAQKFEDYLDEVKPDIIHFQHLEKLSASLIEVVSKRKIPSILTLHDFWFICPQIRLLTAGNKICPGPDYGKRCISCENILMSQIGFQSSKWFMRTKKLVGSFTPWKMRMYLQRKIIKYKIKKQKVTEQSFIKRMNYLKKMLAKVDTMIAPSNFLKEKYVECRFPPQKILYLNYGFNKTLFSGLKRKTSKHIRFGFIGTVFNHKGVEILISAFNKIKNPNATLKIYGWGPEYYIRRVKNLAKKNKKIIFCNRFENKNIARILCRIDVLIVPSIWYENSPLVIHEAYMAKVPVIASNIGGMAEYVKDNKTGLLFEVGNADELARKLKQIVENPDLVKEFSRNINPDKLVKSIGENARELEDIYRKTTKREFLRKENKPMCFMS